MRTLTALTSLLLCVALTPPASASPAPQLDDDEPGAPHRIVLPSPTLAPPRPALDLGPSPAPEMKSPGTALALSLTGYLVPMAVGAGLLMAGRDENAWIGGLVTMGIGASVGPSLGQFYVGNVGRGLLMSAGRGAMATGSYLMIVVGALHGFDGERVSGGLIAGGAVLAAGAFALALWDIIDAPFAARRTNASRSIAVAPILGRDLAGATTGGLAVSGRF